MIALAVTEAGKGHEGRIIVKLVFPKSETHYATVYGIYWSVFDNNQYWLPW